MKDCPFRYQGQYEDGEMGLYYNRFRFYDPNIGNYLNQDPIGLAGNNPTLYGYVKDSNIRIDVWGLSDYLFRADDSYRGGDIGDMPLGGDADITDPYTHVQNKKSGQTSIYTSFGTTKKDVSPKFGTNVSKVNMEDLKKLEAEGKIKIYTPEDVEKMIGGKKGKHAAKSMKNNGEVLVEGIIPGNIVKKCH